MPSVEVVGGPCDGKIIKDHNLYEDLILPNPASGAPERHIIVVREVGKRPIARHISLKG